MTAASFWYAMRQAASAAADCPSSSEESSFVRLPLFVVGCFFFFTGFAFVAGNAFGGSFGVAFGVSFAYFACCIYSKVQ